MTSTSAEFKQRLIKEINESATVSEVCSVIGLDCHSSVDEVTKKRRELYLLIHPDKNQDNQAAASSAFVSMQKSCDFCIQNQKAKNCSYVTGQQEERRRSTRTSKTSNQCDRGRKHHNTDEIPSRRFTKSNAGKKRKYVPPTDDEFDNMVENIDTRASTWRSFLNPEDDAIPSSDKAEPQDDEVKVERRENFVCILCRRCFVSTEHLERHVRESKLHASLSANTG
mmetsp:Transcript_29612/g.49997  ORF Transcript_29612/g.49997 Transcript_29612/m.49997 type:complete len:225 (-) Transcript_29612:1207-1881(-)